MHLFAERGGTRRTVSYGLLGALALIIPTLLGFAVASASESCPMDTYYFHKVTGRIFEL